MIPTTVFVPLLLLAVVVRWLVARLARSHPGPLFARLTPFPYFYHAYQLDLPIWIHELHQRYGDVVEISPSYISLCGPEHLAPLYNSLDKEAFYEQFTNYGAPNMFNTRGKKDHLRRRRMLGLAFSRRSVNTDDGAELMCEKARSLAGCIGEGAQADSCVDVMAAFSYLAMDVITAFVRTLIPSQPELN